MDTTFRSFFATCPRGAEEVLSGELAALGAKGIRPAVGGARFTGPRAVALTAGLSLRTALRLLEPVGDFPAASADELYDGVRALPWAELVLPSQTIAVAATGSAPALNHSHFVALKVKDAICDAVRDAAGARPSVDTERPDVAVVAHLGGGRCQVSLDLAGELLSNRGYRVAGVKAPLREALAAAVVLASGWDRARPLADPLCGGGTIAIEAALVGAGILPGARRTLACERWPRTSAGEKQLLADLRAQAAARSASLRAEDAPPVFASDRDAAAVEATRACARAAGVGSIVRCAVGDARALAPLSPPGQLVFNPPYGERLEAGGRKQLKSVFHAIGDAVKALAGHRVAVLAGSADFESAFGLRPRSRRELWNGPLRCELLLYEVAGSDS